MKINLKQKVSISVIVVIVIFCLVSAGAVYFHTKKLFLENIQEDFRIIAQEQSQEVKQVLMEGHYLLRSLSKHPFLTNYFSQEERLLQDASVLQELEIFNIENHYSAIYVLDKTGTTIVSTDTSFVGKNYQFREYFQKSIQGEEWTDVSLGITSKKLGYYFSCPIKLNNGKIVGVIVAKMKPSVIQSVLPKTKHNNPNTIMFTDKFGVILFSNKADRIFHSLGYLNSTQNQKIRNQKRFKGVSIKPLQYNVLQSELENTTNARVFQFFDTNDNEEKIISIVKIAQFPFYIVSEEAAVFYTNQVRKITFILVGILLFGGFGSVLFIYLILKYIFNPLQKLKKIVQHIIDGDYGKKIKINTGDELEEFAIGFNKMIDSLEQSKKNVERKIAKQTKDLLNQKVDLENQQSAMMSILEDMEEEKNKNERLANDLKKFLLAIENASDHIVITDPDGIILYANPAVEHITGYKLKEIMGQKAGTLHNWGGLMPPAFYEKLWTTLKETKKPFSGEIQQKRKDGTPYDVLAHLSPVLDTQGEVTFFVGIERDITKEKQIDKAKTEFVSLASHQLRTPLSTINWYTEMLLAGDVGKLNKEQEEYLHLVYDGNQRMVELVNSLLNVSRIELGTFAIEPEKIDLPKMADEVLGELVPETKEKKLIIKTHYEKKLPPFKADTKLMRILFQNLLTNAVKYTPEKGTISLTVKTKGKNLSIGVQDTGYGIPINQQSKIFTKLFRADNVRTKDTEGSGLGLYLVKSIVEECKGKISFKSKENKGTTFSILLPLSGMKKKTGAKTLS